MKKQISNKLNLKNVKNKLNKKIKFFQKNTEKCLTNLILFINQLLTNFVD